MGIDVGTGGKETAEGGGTSEWRDGDVGGVKLDRGLEHARDGEAGGGTSEPRGGRGSSARGGTASGGDPMRSITRCSFERSPASHVSRLVGGVHMTASAIAEA